VCVCERVCVCACADKACNITLFQSADNSSADSSPQEQSLKKKQAVTLGSIRDLLSQVNTDLQHLNLYITHSPSNVWGQRLFQKKSAILFNKGSLNSSKVTKNCIYNVTKY